MTTDLCWCGSGKAYADCHSEIDAKIELYRKAGHEVPDREMIKTPEQIAGIREAWHRSISADFLKVSVPRSTIRFATEYRRHRTF